MKKKITFFFLIFSSRCSRRVIKWLQARLDKAVLFLAVQFLMGRASIRLSLQWQTPTLSLSTSFFLSRARTLSQHRFSLSISSLMWAGDFRFWVCLLLFCRLHIAIDRFSQWKSKSDRNKPFNYKKLSYSAQHKFQTHSCSAQATKQSGRQAGRSTAESIEHFTSFDAVLNANFNLAMLTVPIRPERMLA